MEKFITEKRDLIYNNTWALENFSPLYVNTLKAIQEKFNTVRLGEIADIFKGHEPGADNYIKYIEKGKTDVPFIRTSDIVNYEVNQYPDFYLSEEIYIELNQDLRAGDILFTKDGKIGMIGMLTKSDKVIISSGLAMIRLNKNAEKYNITKEYLFFALATKKIGLYGAKRRTVVGSTIPHLKEERLKEIDIPILDNSTIQEITDCIKQTFDLKEKSKKLINEMRNKMDSYFEI